jgi:hypothetical protein
MKVINELDGFDPLPKLGERVRRADEREKAPVFKLTAAPGILEGPDGRLFTAFADQTDMVRLSDEPRRPGTAACSYVIQAQPKLFAQSRVYAELYRINPGLAARAAMRALFGDPRGLMSAFDFGRTPEGREFWQTAAHALGETTCPKGWAMVAGWPTNIAAMREVSALKVIPATRGEVDTPVTSGYNRKLSDKQYAIAAFAAAVGDDEDDIPF